MQFSSTDLKSIPRKAWIAHIAAETHGVFMAGFLDNSEVASSNVSLYSHINQEMCLNYKGATMQSMGANLTTLRNSDARHPTQNMQSRPTLIFGTHAS